MKKESEAILLRIFIGESAEYQGKKLYKHIIEMMKAEGIAGTFYDRTLVLFCQYPRRDGGHIEHHCLGSEVFSH